MGRVLTTMVFAVAVGAGIADAQSAEVTNLQLHQSWESYEITGATGELIGCGASTAPTKGFTSAIDERLTLRAMVRPIDMDFLGPNNEVVEFLHVTGLHGLPSTSDEAISDISLSFDFQSANTSWPVLGHGKVLKNRDASQALFLRLSKELKANLKQAQSVAIAKRIGKLIYSLAGSSTAIGGFDQCVRALKEQHKAKQ